MKESRYLQRSGYNQREMMDDALRNRMTTEATYEFSMSLHLRD